MCRKLATDLYTRERITTPDDDFLDLDWSRIGSRKLAVISHGLEGNSHRSYVVGMVEALNRAGWDCLAWNYRSCSGEINRQLRFYHHGATDDLITVIRHAVQSRRYRRIDLVGFSMGGNLTLVYLGRETKQVPPFIGRAVVFSVPCNLKDCAHRLAKWRNRPYMRYFLKPLFRKLKEKRKRFPDQLNVEGFRKIKTFQQYDDRYTAPLHGFRDAEDYWRQTGSVRYLKRIRVPVLIVNARNDPFLADTCYPIGTARDSSTIFLEMPRSGGHVGFVAFNAERRYWSERRAVEFLQKGA